MQKMISRNWVRTAIHRQSGFTLIELLVVIAIIAILAAILFPVFARARENARRASCQSNLKQQALGVLQYQQDYDERFPLYRNDSGTWLGFWPEQIMPYVKSTQIFECPSYKNAYAGGAGTYGVQATPNSNQNGSLASYGMNLALVPSLTTSIAVSSLNNTAELLMIADTSRKPVLSPLTCLGYQPDAAANTGTDPGQGTTGEAITFYDNTAGTTIANYNLSGPDCRHLETVNVAYADGHVKALKYNAVYKVPSGVSPNTNWRLWYPAAP